MNCLWYVLIAAELIATGPIALLPHTVSAQSLGCADGQIQLRAADVAHTRNALLDIRTREDFETQVSDEANRGIVALKNRLDAMIVAYMHCLETAAPDPAQIERQLSLLAQAPEDSNTGGDAQRGAGTYGTALKFEVSVVADDRHLVSIVARFGIGCGTDSMLLIFAPAATTWNVVLRWQSHSYKEVSGAFEAFQFGISPADKARRWYVVTSHIRPWCSSTWSSIDYEVLRPVPGTSRPKILFTGSDSMWWGGEDFGHLTLNAGDFELRFHGESIDPGVHNRAVIRRYAIAGTSVRRIQPVADSASDFVDEWIVSPWSQAAQWSLPMHINRLEQIHAQLQRKHREYIEYGSIHSCPNVADTVQIELHHGDADRAFYFRVVGRGSFSLSDVAETPDSACSGDAPVTEAKG